MLIHLFFWCDIKVSLHDALASSANVREYQKIKKRVGRAGNSNFKSACVYLFILSIDNSKLPSVKNFHDLYLYEYNPFHLNVYMHYVVADKGPNDSVLSKQAEINEISDKIKKYLSNYYFIHRVYLQPEYIQVIFQTQFDKNLG